MPAFCSLLLDVYQLGGVDVDWSVSSDPAHVAPYLLGPKNYDAQEIDPVSAAATIGTVDVGVIDPAQTPGNQITGWMTQRVGSIRGRRCVLRRYIDDTIGYVLIADGPAGMPALDASYSAYRWPIRDTREIERKLAAFNSGGTTAIMPRGPINGFGALPGDTWLLDPVTPVVGIYSVEADGYGGLIGRVNFPAWDAVDFDVGQVISKEGESMLDGRGDGARSIFPTADVLWRLAGLGSENPWNVARPSLPPPFITGEIPLAAVEDAVVDGADVRAVRNVILWWHSGLVYTGTEPFGASEIDGVGEEVEVIIRHRGAASTDSPYYFEGTAGALLAALYDGALSTAPDLLGEHYDPAGLDAIAALMAGAVRYDAAAVSAITIPVLLRQTAPVADGRAWAESAIYGPSGWIPALDQDGVISPVSRERPSVITGPLIVDAKTEPSPDWNAGERIVTAVQLTYNRYYIDPHAEATIEPDGLSVRPVSVEYLDPDAEAVEDAQPVVFDGAVFSAIGDANGLALAGDVESGALLAQAARYEVLGRYRAGAQAMRVRVRRVDVPTLRVGDWCPAQLSWLPNTGTGLRGMDLPAVQVLSIDDSECAWRALLLEESPIFAQPGYLDSIEIVSDEGGS